LGHCPKQEEGASGVNRPVEATLPASVAALVFQPFGVLRFVVDRVLVFVVNLGIGLASSVLALVSLSHSIVDLVASHVLEDHDIADVLGGCLREDISAVLVDDAALVRLLVFLTRHVRELEGGVPKHHLLEVGGPLLLLAGNRLVFFQVVLVHYLQMVSDREGGLPVAREGQALVVVEGRLLLMTEALFLELFEILRLDNALLDLPPLHDLFLQLGELLAVSVQQVGVLSPNVRTHVTDLVLLPVYVFRAALTLTTQIC